MDKNGVTATQTELALRDPMAQSSHSTAVTNAA